MFTTNLVLMFGADITVGVLLEVVGRKYVTGFGMILASVCIGLVGTPFSLVELYFLRFFVSTGVLPILMSPLVADYVEKEY